MPIENARVGLMVFLALLGMVLSQGGHAAGKSIKQQSDEAQQVAAFACGQAYAMAHSARRLARTKRERDEIQDPDPGCDTFRQLARKSGFDALEGK